MENKIRLCVLFGGRSAEHEISVVSARSLVKSINRERYDLFLIGIDREGRWFTSKNESDILENSQISGSGKTAIRLDHFSGGSLIDDDGHTYSVDVVFPLLHGTFGEDGSVQGLLELSGIAYVGSGVAGSAVGMDKEYMKRAFAAEGLPQLDYHVLSRNQWYSNPEDHMLLIEGRLTYPLFVKPANMGSSIGISRVDKRDYLQSAIDQSARYDNKIIVEQAAHSCVEIEVAIIGNEHPEASMVGEIELAGRFYDYKAKYSDDGSILHIPARIAPATAGKIRDLGVRAYSAVGASGLSRVDFFVRKNGDKIYINEINTMPGFTPKSMFPQLWEASGVSYSNLIDQLIDLAIEKHRDKNLNLTK